MICAVCVAVSTSCFFINHWSERLIGRVSNKKTQYTMSAIKDIKFENVVNLTPHAINVGDVKFDVYADVEPVRLHSSVREELESFAGVAVWTSQLFTGVVFPDLPEATQAVLVSMPVGQYVRDNDTDLPYRVFGPDMSPQGAVRDENGRPVGCKNLVLYK